MGSFNNARDFDIGTLNLTNIGSLAQIYNQAPTVDPALQILHKARAAEATHTSKTASYAPKCKPGTRKKVIQDMVDWILVDDSTDDDGQAGDATSILWLQGPAGGGKTCIMREVVSRCEEAGLVVASYFFSTRGLNLDKEEPFIATIAHQLATGDIAPRLLKAISVNPAVFDESLERQAKQLLVGPLSSGNSCHRIIVIVDGLDECRETEGRQQRVHILSIFRMLVTSIPNLRILVASRPELDIRTTFASQDYVSITHPLRLQDYDGSSEIRDFLCDEFCRIREYHPLKDLIPLDWPVEDVITKLVRKSSGSYIYPSTLLKYVGNPRRNPVMLLDDALALRTSFTNSLAELDSLYHLILHPPDTDIPLLRRLLHSVMALHETMAMYRRAYRWRPYNKSFTPEFLDELFFLPAGTTRIMFCELHSLIFVPEVDGGLNPSIESMPVVDIGGAFPLCFGEFWDSDDGVQGIGRHGEGGLTFHHKSLEDYLKDPSRSGDLYLPLIDTLQAIAASMTLYLNDWIFSNCEELSQGQPSSLLCYALTGWNWAHHLLEFFTVVIEAGTPTALESLPQSIVYFDPEDVWTIMAILKKHDCSDIYVALKSYFNVRKQHEAMHENFCLSLKDQKVLTCATECLPMCTKLAESVKMLDEFLKHATVSINTDLLEPLGAKVEFGKTLDVWSLKRSATCGYNPDILVSILLPAIEGFKDIFERSAIPSDETPVKQVQASNSPGDVGTDPSTIDKQASEVVTSRKSGTGGKACSFEPKLSGSGSTPPKPSGKLPQVRRHMIAPAGGGARAQTTRPSSSRQAITPAAGLGTPNVNRKGKNSAREVPKKQGWRP